MLESKNNLELIEKARKVLRSHGCTEESIKELLSPPPFGIGNEKIDRSEDAIYNARFVIEQEQEKKMGTYTWGDYKKEAHFKILASYAFD